MKNGAVMLPKLTLGRHFEMRRKFISIVLMMIGGMLSTPGNFLVLR